MVQIQEPSTGKSSKILRLDPQFQFATVAALFRAWVFLTKTTAAQRKVLTQQNGTAEGLLKQLTALSETIFDGAYAPKGLQLVNIRTANKDRILEIPAMQDRIVERALADQLVQQLDPLWSPYSFGYRVGSSRQLAIAAAEQGREEIGKAVIRADIKDCFPSLDLSQVERALAATIGEGDFLEFVLQFLYRQRPGTSPHKPVAQGIPLGSPLSPLFCNIALDDFDLQLFEAGFRPIRYADDLVIPLTSKSDAPAALTEIKAIAATQMLELNTEKTQVLSYRKGFVFLGDEIKVLPKRSQKIAQSPASATVVPVKRTLYLGKPGSLLRVNKGTLLVEVRGKSELSLPQGQVSRIVCIGPVGVTAGVRQWVLYSGTPVVFLSARGGYLGEFTSFRPKNVRIRKLQYRLSDTQSFRLAVGRAMIGGKLANQRSLLLRYSGKSTKEQCAAAVRKLKTAALNLGNVHKVNGLLGVEGDAAKSYWQAFSTLIPAEYGFRSRAYRPSPDAVNAALSFGYSLLASEITGAIHAIGLDPAIGFVHSLRNGRASLAYDLIEEFRPLVVDTVVLEMARRRMLSVADAPQGQGSFNSEDQVSQDTRLSRESVKALLRRYEKRMVTEFYHLREGRRVSYRRAVQLQVEALARAVSSRSGQSYQPVSWRW